MSPLLDFSRVRHGKITRRAPPDATAFPVWEQPSETAGYTKCSLPIKNGFVPHYDVFDNNDELVAKMPSRWFRSDTSGNSEALSAFVIPRGATDDYQINAMLMNQYRERNDDGYQILITMEDVYGGGNHTNIVLLIWRVCVFWWNLQVNKMGSTLTSTFMDPEDRDKVRTIAFLQISPDIPTDPDLPAKVMYQAWRSSPRNVEKPLSNSQEFMLILHLFLQDVEEEQKTLDSSFDDWMITIENELEQSPWHAGTKLYEDAVFFFGLVKNETLPKSVGISMFNTTLQATEISREAHNMPSPQEIRNQNNRLVSREMKDQEVQYILDPPAIFAILKHNYETGKPREYSLHFLNFVFTTRGGEGCVGQHKPWGIPADDGYTALWDLVALESTHVWSGDLYGIHLDEIPSVATHTRRPLCRALNRFMGNGHLHLVTDREVKRWIIEREDLAAHAGRLALTDRLHTSIRPFFDEECRLLLRPSIQPNAIEHVRPVHVEIPMKYLLCLEGIFPANDVEETVIHEDLESLSLRVVEERISQAERPGTFSEVGFSQPLLSDDDEDEKQSIDQPRMVTKFPDTENNGRETLNEAFQWMKTAVQEYEERFLRDLIDLVDQLHDAGTTKHSEFPEALVNELRDRVNEYRERINVEMTAVVDPDNPAIMESLNLMEGQQTKQAKILIHLLSYVKWHNRVASHPHGWYAGKMIHWKRVFPKSQCITSATCKAKANAFFHSTELVVQFNMPLFLISFHSQSLSKMAGTNRSTRKYKCTPDSRIAATLREINEKGSRHLRGWRNIPRTIG